MHSRRLTIRGAAVAAALCLCGSGSAMAQAHFYRGDANHDMGVDISDAVATLAFLFSGADVPPCRDAADVDDSGSLDITDGIYTLVWLFQGGEAPAAPYPTFEGDPTPDNLDCLGTPVEISGEITQDLTLTRDRSYRLVSGVFVRDGATLSIEPGTTILGDSASQGFLVITRGARIDAVGTSTHPVVFTSDRPVGERARGDWGGIVILGRGDNNVDGKEAVAEGLEGDLWGGGATPDDDDDSGRLSYVRIEFGGTEISPDNEINALSLFGVGAATQIDHIQVRYNLDDGIEWFGGAVNVRNVVAIGIGDDSFDYSFGWSGNGQFWVCQQRGDDADRGFEVDNHEDAFGNTPLTLPKIANVTLIGDPSTDETRPESDAGLVLRRGCGGLLYKFVVVGFKDAGGDIDDCATTVHSPQNGELAVDWSVFHDNGENFETGDSDETEDGTCFAYTSLDFFTVLNENNVSASESPIVSPYDLGAPDFRAQGDALSNPFDVTTLGEWFQATDYAGAVAPTGADWTHAGWLSYSQN